MPFYSQDYLRAHPDIRRTHLSFGRHPETGNEYLIPDRDRSMAVHVIGKAGSGKSSGLKNLIHQDAQKGHAIIVIDPHGDLADESMAELPQARVADTFVLDMRDESFPFGVNVFSEAGTLTTDEERTQAIERILSIFDVLWPEVLKQQYAPMLLRCAVIAFLENPGSTLVDMLDFFRDDAFRAQILARVNDRSIRDFFRYEYDEQSPQERTRRVQPLMNRLQSLFVGRALPRAILGQRVNSVNFRKAIEQHQIILIKLPTTTMREDARLIGTILMSQITAAIFSFVDLPPERRPVTCLYVDEVSTVVTPDFERLVVEGRKFGVWLTISHQNMGQLPDYLRRAAKGMHTRVVFRVTPEDARDLAPDFPPREQSSGHGDVDPNPLKYLLHNGAPDPLVTTFIDVYLRPLQHQKSAGQVEVLSERTVTFMDSLFPAAMGSGGKKEPVFLPDPTFDLDALLRDVMLSGDPMRPIPWKAIAGFANCGLGFYHAVKRARHSGELTEQLLYPAYLANHTARGYVWLRQPESEHEQLLHLIFHLRAVMMYLAAHPILKSGKAPMVDFAQILIQLPVRMALVRSGDDVGQIVTSDTPKPLAGEALSARRYFILQSTRQRYCHPREQVERLIDDTTPPDALTLRRWETVQSHDEADKQKHVPDAPDLRHAAPGDSAGASGAVSAATADGGAADDPPLPLWDAQDGQGPTEDPYDLWVRAIRRGPEP